MSVTRSTNGTIKLTSFAELGSVFSLAPSPADEDTSALTKPVPPSQVDASQLDTRPAATDLAEVIAQLASMSGGLEAMAREDARAREEATLDLARYEAMLAELKDAERSLAEARRVRASAEALAAQAFSEQARTAALQHAASSRALELRCIELLAERRRTTQELASRPRLARMLAEAERRAQEQAEAERAAATERTERLRQGLAEVDAALSSDDVDRAHACVQILAREFAEDAEVRRRLGIVRWRLRQRIVAPAEAALRDLTQRACRDDPEAALARLAELRTDGLPEDLARRVFGIWSNTCWQVVHLRGWQDPRRESPGTSRGAVWARTPEGVYKVVSSLAHPRWQPGRVVPDEVARTAPPLLSIGTRARRNTAAA